MNSEHILTLSIKTLQYMSITLTLPKLPLPRTVMKLKSVALIVSCLLVFLDRSILGTFPSSIAAF
jgi:hypothetical protein